MTHTQTFIKTDTHIIYMGTEKTRMAIIQKLQNTFLKAGSAGISLDKLKLVSELCMSHGVTKQKALEYVQVLKDADFIKEDEFGLWLSEKVQVTLSEADAIVSSHVNGAPAQ